MEGISNWKDFVVEVMIKPLPRVLLNCVGTGFVAYEGTIILGLGVLYITGKLQSCKKKS